jgi:hypothetical protein
MMRYLAALLRFPALIVAGQLPPPGTDGPSQRAYQVAVISRIAEPVLTAASENNLKATLPKIGNERDRYAPLEALGRTLTGVAPWLELGPGDDIEGQLRGRYIQFAVKAISNSVDPKSDGFLNFTQGGQPLVDAAFLAQSLLRAPKQLWGNLDDTTRTNLIAALKSTRTISPADCNWLLFSAIIEATLFEFTGECEMAPIEKAISRHLEWYKGDGTYGDGHEFHWDYYNSFVIQPMLWEVLEVCNRKNRPEAKLYDLIRERARRYAEVQERMISPEGTFPVIGRSATYRFGAFQTLSFVALRHQLPDSLPPGAVRNALNAVIHRMVEAPNTFDAQGWLTIGVVGPQRRMAEGYINTGSLYLCTAGLLQLGLPANDPFWTEPGRAWTQKRIWAGEDVTADHAIKN